MEHKAIIIGGGIAAVSLVAFLAFKNKGQAQQDSGSDMPDTSYFGGMLPTSGGMSSGDSGGGISDPGNSGSSDTGGGFDIGDMFAKLFSTQAETSSLQIRSGANVAESAILSGIDFGAFGGNASVNHTSTGTTLSVNHNGDGYDQIIASSYQSTLGRQADTGGAAFFKNALMNGGLSVGGLTQQLMGSNEYASAHPAIQSPTAAPASTYAPPPAVVTPISQASQSVQYSDPSPYVGSVAAAPVTASAPRYTSYKAAALQ